MAIGKVIKGDISEPNSEVRPALRPPRAGVVNAQVYEAHQSAQQIIDDAKAKAQEIVASAEKEREKLFAEAREKGRQDGLAQVTEQIARAKLLRTEMLKGSEAEMVALAIKIAEKIIGREIKKNPEVLAEICAAAIEHARNARELVVRVNPGDAQILRERKAKVMELVGRVKEIAIKDDPDIPSGGCLIETDSGTIDAKLSTQLEMIQNVLLDVGGKKDGPA